MEYVGWLLVVELRVESVGDDLGVGESPAGRPLPVLSARPVGLTHHEPQLTHLNIDIKIFVCEPKIYLLIHSPSPGPASAPSQPSAPAKH